MPVISNPVLRNKLKFGYEVVFLGDILVDISDTRNSIQPTLRCSQKRIHPEPPGSRERESESRLQHTSTWHLGMSKFLDAPMDH